MRGRRVLVTGMGGELGSLVTSHLEQCDWVGGIAGCDVDPPRRLLRRAQFERVASNDHRRITSLVRGFNPQVIVHMGVWEPHARLSTSEARTHTEQMTRAVFDAAHEVEALESVVVRSGVEIYGASTHSPRIAVESTPILPTTTYGHMLNAIEHQANDLHIARGVPVCTLRLAPVLGPHVPSPLGRILRMPAVPYHGIGNPAFSVVEDHDAAHAFCSAAERAVHGIVNIVANGAISVLRAAMVGRRLPVPSFGPGWWMARNISLAAGAPVPDHVADLLTNGRLVASNEAAHLLRFAPNHSTAEVIDRLYQWPSIERVPARRQVA